MSTQTMTPRLNRAHRRPFAAIALGLALVALVALAIVTRPAQPALRPAADIHPVTAAELVELKEAQAEAREAVVMRRALPDATTATERALLNEAQAEAREAVVMRSALPDATTATERARLNEARAEAQGIVRALPDATTAAELVELKQNQVESR